MNTSNRTFRVKHAVLLALLVMLALTVQPVLGHYNKAYAYETTIGLDRADWMAALPDDVKIGELSLPGTHDTMSYQCAGLYCTDAFYVKDWVLTQQMDLSTQLNSGIRVLDIRLQYVDGKLDTYHGLVDLDNDFDYVIETTIAFLEAHPTEVVFMRVDDNKNPTNSGFGQAFINAYRYYEHYPYFWDDDNNWETWPPYGTSPTSWTPGVTYPELGDVRGKIVLVQGFGTNTTTDDGSVIRAGLLEEWMDDQNEWNLDDRADLYHKWELVEAQLEDAESPYDIDPVTGLPRRDRDGNPYYDSSIIHINYLSASNSDGAHELFPWFVASGHTDKGTSSARAFYRTTALSQCNNATSYQDWPHVYINNKTGCEIYFEGTNILAMNKILGIPRYNYPPFTPLPPPLTHRVGIVYADFPGAGLIDAIINVNTWRTPPDAVVDSDPEDYKEGNTIGFDASGSTSAYGDALWYRWKVEDDEWTGWSDSPSFAHKFADDGTYTVTLEVSDRSPELLPDDETTRSHFVTSLSTEIIVSNLAPEIFDNLANPRTINENEEVTVSGTIRDDGIEDTFDIVIDWGDGTMTVIDDAGPGEIAQDRNGRYYQELGYDVTHRYSDDPDGATSGEEYAISVTVIDDDGDEVSANTEVTVNNVAPNILDNLVTPQTIDENQEVAVSGTIRDYGIEDTFDIVIDWGDGTTTTVDDVGPGQNHETTGVGKGGVTVTQRLDYEVTHRYLDDPDGAALDETYEISVTVTDDDGGVVSAITEVAVNNVDPEITANGDVIDENDFATVSGTIRDDGNEDTFDIVIDWGDGTTTTIDDTGPGIADTSNEFQTLDYEATHQYLDDNPTGTPSDDYVISITVTDDDGDVDNASANITVNNVAPEVTANGDVIDENGVATVHGDITDPGSEDSFSVTVNWGDGTTTVHLVGEGEVSYSATRQYLDDNPTGTPSDDYTISVTVTDDDEGVGNASATVTVNNVAPVASIDHVTDELGDELGLDVPVALVGLVVNVEGSFTDVGTQDTHTTSIAWGDGAADDAPDTLTGNHAYAALGSYTIELAVTDDDTGTDAPTTEVTVVDAQGAITILAGQLSPFTGNPHVARAVNRLIGANGGNGEGGALDHLERGNLIPAMEMIRQAMQELEAAEASDPALDLSGAKSLLVLTAKSIAVNAVAQAEAAASMPADARKIQNAIDSIAQGDGYLTNRDFGNAVESFQEAVRVAATIQGDNSGEPIQVPVADSQQNSGDDSGGDDTSGEGSSGETDSGGGGTSGEGSSGETDSGGDDTSGEGSSGETDSGGDSESSSDPQAISPTEALAEVVVNLQSLPGTETVVDILSGDGGALDNLEQNNVDATLAKFIEAIEALEAAESADGTLDGTYTRESLALIARNLVADSIDIAQELASKPKDQSDIDEARALVANGDDLVVLLDYAGAIEDYHEAYQKIQGIVASSAQLSGAAGGSGGAGALAIAAGTLALAGGGYYLWQRRKTKANQTE